MMLRMMTTIMITVGSIGKLHAWEHPTKVIESRATREWKTGSREAAQGTQGYWNEQ
jgi:hypothetical protein